MRYSFFRVLFCGLVLCLYTYNSNAQTDIETFRNFQFSFSRVSQACNKYNDSVTKDFRRQGISFPCGDVFLRVFKSQNQMELWGRNDGNSDYRLIKTYRICALSGGLGPKRFEGDRQVPEGFYFIDDFNPKSDYYLSLLLNYPNYLDTKISNNQNPGGDIYIHGGCVTVGCMPMTDDVIQELYAVCMGAKLNGEAYIPVQIYPVRFNKAGLNYLGKSFPQDADKQKFWVNLKENYDYFERYHRLLPVMYTLDGKYAN